MRTSRYLSLVLCLGLTCCAHNKPMVQNDVELLHGFIAHSYSDIYFSGQPPLSQLAKLKKLGFASIVNLRQEKEGDYKEVIEKAAAEKAGLNYSHVPVSSKVRLNDKIISQITQAVVKNRKQGKTLVHCSSGNRVGLWVGGHFYKDHGYSKQKALEMGQRMGVTKVSVTENLKKYLGI